MIKAEGLAIHSPADPTPPDLNKLIWIIKISFNPLCLHNAESKAWILWGASNTDCVSTWVSDKGTVWGKQCPREAEASTQLQLMVPQEIMDQVLSSLDFSREMGNWDFFFVNSASIQLLIKVLKNSVNHRKHMWAYPLCNLWPAPYNWLRPFLLLFPNNPARRMLLF